MAGLARSSTHCSSDEPVTFDSGTSSIAAKRRLA